MEPRVYTDDRGAIWFDRGNGRPRELLSGEDEICGVGIFATDEFDCFRLACAVHDNFYTKRDFFEARGWTRLKMDNYFLELMLEECRGDCFKKAKAYYYYSLVRAIGWLPYERHQSAIAWLA